VNQPTHPAYYEDDVRHHKCNVCLTQYTCPPPTRGELMESFTGILLIVLIFLSLALLGPEIAASLFEGRIIASRDIFSASLENQLQEFSPVMRAMSGYEHWIKGVYLITQISPDELEKTLMLDHHSSVEGLLSRLDENLQLAYHGQQLQLIRAINTSGSAPTDVNLRDWLQSCQPPVSVTLRVTTPITCADDHIVAVNIARQVQRPVCPDKFDMIYRSACVRNVSISRIDIRHYIGGPVDEDNPTCIVYGGTRGWTVVSDIKKALFLGATRADRKYGGICSGQTVRVMGLVARPELNGRIGMALRFHPSPGPDRWDVILVSGEGIRIKPVNLEGLDGGSGRVMVFWGDARWSRAQLLGEIRANRCFLTDYS
jgi:hypothetical protein